MLGSVTIMIWSSLGFLKEKQARYRVCECRDVVAAIISILILSHRFLELSRKALISKLSSSSAIPSVKTISDYSRSLR
jgi:hypothetical protein